MQKLVQILTIAALLSSLSTVTLLPSFCSSALAAGVGAATASGATAVMPTSKSSESGETILGWYRETSHGDYKVELDKKERHTGSRSAHMKSLVDHPSSFGNILQAFSADAYKGKRLQMSVWVKTKISKGTVQPWIRIDGDWQATRPGSFDNMGDRPIAGNTDWTRYNLVVDVPETSTYIYFGCMLIGTGEFWLDDISFEEVGKDVPLTGPFTNSGSKQKPKPENLNFEQTEK